MSLPLLLLGYLYYFKSKIIVKSDYSLDTLQEKDLLDMAFSRYWQTKELVASHVHDTGELPVSDGQEANDIQADDFQGLTKAAIHNNNLKQVKAFLHKAASAGAPDSKFYEVVAAFYYSQPDHNKYGAFGAEYLLALNKLVEFHDNDGKYLLGRADYFKKCEDYDASRADYKQLMNIYPDDLWIPYAIAFTYRKQELKDESKVYLKYIKKSLPKIQVRLQSRAGSGDARDQAKSVFDSNEQVGIMTKDLLKARKAAVN